MRHASLLVTLLTLILAPSAPAADLSVGDTAPGFSIEEWVKGDEQTLQNGKVYLVEFFATDKGRLQRTVPMLSELQEEFGDRGLIVIGVSEQEADDVKRWARSQGEKLGYTVAVDRRGVTTREWMSKAGRDTVPTAFIVDRKSKIAYIGDTLSEELATILEKVLRGRFAPTLDRQARQKLDAARRHRRVKSWRMAKQRYDEIIDLDPSVFAEVALERFEMMLVDMADRDEAYRYLQNELMAKRFVKDPEALKDIAEKITLDRKITPENRDLDVALEAATALHQLAGKADWRSLTTLALVHFHRQEFQQAIGLQYRAWKLARPKYKAELKRVLRSYQVAARRGAVE